MPHREYVPDVFCTLNAIFGEALQSFILYSLFSFLKFGFLDNETNHTVLCCDKPKVLKRKALPF